MKKKLTKSSKEKMIGGVCGGFAEYANVDPTLIRLAFVVLTVMDGLGVLLYLFALVVMPSEQKARANKTIGDAATDADDERDGLTDKLGVEAESKRSFYAGVTLVVVGLVMFVVQFVPSVGLAELGPLALLAVGAYLVYRAFEPKNGEAI
jgi:phage shock protein C